eukprot:scaffold1291_cov412-Prasinococcus_capsulatus_cf.AAC.4
MWAPAGPFTRNQHPPSGECCRTLVWRAARLCLSEKLARTSPARAAREPGRRGRAPLPLPWTCPPRRGRVASPLPAGGHHSQHLTQTHTHLDR